MQQLLEQTYKGFYGDCAQHDGVTKELCADVIRHSIGYCNDLITQDDSLDGIMGNLQTELSAAPTDVVQDIEADMDPFPGVVKVD